MCLFWHGRQVVRPGSAKALYVGSIPTRASKKPPLGGFFLCRNFARVVELVDTRDLKSLGYLMAVPVQVRPRAPKFISILDRPFSNTPFSKT